MEDKSRAYTAEALDLHFADSILPSSPKANLRITSPGTFNVWQNWDESTPTQISADVADPVNFLLSRVTIFARGAQPWYPPFIYTRSESDTLTRNIGRPIPIFRQIPFARGEFTWDGYVKVISVEIIAARSDDLRALIAMKVQQGGLRKERTKEQWEETFGENWCKVTLEPVDIEIGDPMAVANIRTAIASLMESG